MPGQDAARKGTKKDPVNMRRVGKSGVTKWMESQMVAGMARDSAPGRPREDASPLRKQPGMPKKEESAKTELQ